MDRYLLELANPACHERRMRLVREDIARLEASKTRRIAAAGLWQLGVAIVAEAEARLDGANLVYNHNTQREEAAPADWRTRWLEDNS